jgi:hypothetical protein
MPKKPTCQTDEGQLPSTIRRILGRWPGVEIGKSRFGGLEAFFVEGREFAHFHGPNELDIRLTRRVQRVQRAQPSLLEDERVGFRERPSDWVTYRFENSEDCKCAEALLRLAWQATSDQRMS